MSRIERKDIPKSVKLQVFKRAGGPEYVQCEGCGLMLRGKKFHYDHTVCEWMRTEAKSARVITADDVKLLGWDCCHKGKTSSEAGQRAHGNRLIEKAARARHSSQPIPGSRRSQWKRKMDGTLERRS